MTNELVKILEDLKELLENQASDNAPNEEDFLAKLKEFNEALTEELKKPQPEQTKIE